MHFYSSQEDNIEKEHKKSVTLTRSSVRPVPDHSISPWLVSNEVVSTPASKTKEIIIRKSVITTQL